MTFTISALFVVNLQFSEVFKIVSDKGMYLINFFQTVKGEDMFVYDAAAAVLPGETTENLNFNSIVN